jgi:hypothetical protein
MTDRTVKFPVKDANEKPASSSVPRCRPTAEAVCGKMNKTLNCTATAGMARLNSNQLSLARLNFSFAWASRIKRLESHLNLFMLLQLVRDGKRETSHIVFE